MKKLPFKPTALRKRAQAPAPTPSDEPRREEVVEKDDDGLSMFRRGKEMASILAADRERAMRRKEKQKTAERRRRSSDAENHLVHERVEKNGEEAESSRTVDVPQSQETDQSSQPNAPMDDANTVTETGDSELVTPPPSKRMKTQASSSRLTPSRRPRDSPSQRRTPTKRPARSPIPVGTPIIALDSDPEDNEIALPPRSRSGSVEGISMTQPTAPPEPEPHAIEEEEEDEEFLEYVRKAEQQKREQASRKFESPGSASISAVDILLTSEIEGTKNCCIKLNIDQPLLKTRAAWVAVQEKHGNSIPGEASDLILTWRGSKVYNYSSLYSLGIRPHGDRLFVNGSRSKSGLSNDGLRVHMEVWTPESFQQWEEEEDRRRKVQAGELSEEEDYEEPEAPEEKLKVVLKAKDLEEVRFTARPGTTMETLVTGFKAQKKLGPETEVSLWFDGERMEEHVTIEEAEIDDMDTIEVHVK